MQVLYWHIVYLDYCVLQFSCVHSCLIPPLYTDIPCFCVTLCSRLLSCVAFSLSGAGLLAASVNLCLGCCRRWRCQDRARFFILGSLPGSLCCCGCGLLCGFLVRFFNILPILLDSLEYSLDCSSTPAMMRSTTVGFNSMRMVVPTSVSLHFISYFFHSTRRYSTASVVGQELSMARRPSQEVLYCLLHLMYVAMELSMESLSLSSPSFVWNCLSTSSRERVSPMESLIVVE